MEFSGVIHQTLKSKHYAKRIHLHRQMAGNRVQKP